MPRTEITSVGHTGTPLHAPWNILFSLATRAFVWGLIFLLLYVLSSFFLLIFLTFVFSYILANGAARLEPYIKNRTRRVVLFSSLFVTILISLSLYLTPRVIQQAEGFAAEFGVYVQRIDQEIFNMSLKYPVLQDLVQQLKDPDDKHINPAQSSPTLFFLKQLTGITDDTEDPKKKLEYLVNSMKNIGVKIISMLSAFLLALLFSFLIVLDLPKLSASVQGLQYTRLCFIYEEVADSIRNFGRVLGQAFEAQFMIALLNTGLTAIGLYFLGLGQHIAFLSVIVLLFSFVPVAGVFISSIPICLIALQIQGVPTMFAAIGLIVIIHMIEGYILNPRIYGYRLRINPVIVLIILTIGGKLFQFWGLILGVPICIYLFGHAIRLPKPAPETTQETTQETIQKTTG